MPRTRPACVQYRDQTGQPVTISSHSALNGISLALFQSVDRRNGSALPRLLALRAVNCPGLVAGAVDQLVPAQVDSLLQS